MDLTISWTRSMMRNRTFPVTTTRTGLTDGRIIVRLTSWLRVSYEEALDEIHHQSVDRIARRVATQRPDPDRRRHFEAVYGRFGLRIIEATGETDDVTPLIRGRYDIALNEIKVSQPSTRARSSATRARPSLESVNHANAGTRSG
jgi:hypothetical protein